MRSDCKSVGDLGDAVVATDTHEHHGGEWIGGQLVESSHDVMHRGVGVHIVNGVFEVKHHRTDALAGAACDRGGEIGTVGGDVEGCAQGGRDQAWFVVQRDHLRWLPEQLSLL